MSTRIFLNCFAVGAGTAALLAAAPAAEAQQDSISLQVDSALARLAARPDSMRIDYAGGFPLILGVSAGRGSQHSPCASCAKGGALFEAAAGLRITRGLSVILNRGTASSKEEDRPWLKWTTVSVRVRPAAELGLFVEAGAGKARASRDHRYTVERTTCDWSRVQWFWVIPWFPEGACSDYSEARTEYLPSSGAVAQLGVGYELALGHKIAVVPQLRVMPGHAGVSGFSIGLRYGEAGTLVQTLRETRLAGW